MRNISSFSNVSRSENTGMNVTQNALKPGQMLTGKVLELYPNQRAAIQLGGSQVVAQLETALSSKQNYLFQVTSVSDVIRLKKMSDSPLQNNKPVSDQIMQQLGLTNNRQLKTFIQQLVSQNIPFTYKDGQALAKLLEQFGGNSTNRDLLASMTKQNFPLTEQVFRSLQAFQSSQLGTQINQLQQHLAQFNQSNTLISQLQQQLSLFSSASPSQAHSMLQQFVHTKQPAIEQVLSKAIPDQLSSLQQLTNGDRLTNNQTQYFTQQLNQLLKQQFPFQQGEKQTFQTFLQRFGQMIEQGSVTKTFKNVVQQPFFQKIVQTMSRQDQQLVQQWLQQSSLTNGNQERQVFSILQQMNVQQLSQPDQNLVRSLLLHLNATSLSSLPIKDQFLHMIKHFAQTSGIQDEAQLAQAIRSNGTTHSASQLVQSMMTGLTQQDRQVMHQWIAQSQPSTAQNQQVADMIQRINLQQIPQSEQSLVRQVQLSLEATDQIVNKEQFLQMGRQVTHQGEQTSIQTREMEYSLKQTLLLANQQNPDTANNQMQRLIQSLTGMQLNMVQDEQAITQQSFHIPGERFGLAKDIRMQFEGKKRQDSEEIDPAFCRVLFHLDLHTLGETMIAMSIQKRIVHISVYNDQQGIKPLMDTFTPLLKERLSELNYQLSSVTQKALSDKEHQAMNSNHTAYKPIKREGIDFRI